MRIDEKINNNIRQAPCIFSKRNVKWIYVHLVGKLIFNLWYQIKQEFKKLPILEMPK